MTNLLSFGGKGVREERKLYLKEIFSKLSSVEAKYFTKLLVGEQRAGLKEGIILKALSIYFKKPEMEILNLYQLSGGFEGFLKNVKSQKKPKIEVFKPIPMMLAQKAEKHTWYFY
jgi:ATP-dependent DNA ligase